MHYNSMRIKLWLVEHNVSQERFADMIGMHPVSINRIVNGGQGTSEETLQKIEAFTGLRREDLIQRE